MADTKVSDLTSASASAAADLLMIIQGGQNKKLTIANFLANLNSPVVINAAQTDQDTRIEGTTDSALFFVDADVNRVGIGTATPTQKLHVLGNVHIEAGFLEIDGHGSTLDTGSGARPDPDVSKWGAGHVLTGASSTRSLPDGVDGQIFWYTFYQGGGGSGTHTLTPVHPIGFSSVVFSYTNGNASLIKFWFAGGGWNVTSTYGGPSNGVTVNP